MESGLSLKKHMRVRNAWLDVGVCAQAVERSERPWLMLLTSLSALSALLLALVFWKLHSIQ